MEQTLSKESQVVQAVKKLSKELKKIKSEKAGLTTVLSTGARKRLNDIVTHIDDSIKNSPLNWIPAKEKLFTTIGIEYTFLKRKKVKLSEDEIVKKIVDLSDKRQPWNKKVHQDGSNVIEFASPAHKTWEDLLNTYRVTTATAKKVGLVTKRHDEGSGGGHIHLGIPRHWHTNFRLKFLKTLYLDLSSRPYLNWIFNEPIDDKNASSFLTSKEGIKFIKKLDYKTYISLNDIDDIGGKSFGVRYDGDYDTVEFRIFDMVESEQMLEEYIEFVNAYFRYIYNLSRNHFYSIEYGISYYNLNNTTFDKYKEKKVVVSEFNKLLKEFGLNPNKYKKYITKNYDTRIKLSQKGQIKMDYDSLAGIDFSTLNTESGCETKGYDTICMDGLGDTLPSSEENISLIARLDAIGQLVFEKVDAKKKVQETEVYHRWTGTSGVLGGTLSDNVIVHRENPYNQETVNVPALVVDESMTGIDKYIIGPGKTLTISGAPISNSSPNNFLVVTKKADESLNFDYLTVISNEPVAANSDSEIIREDMIAEPVVANSEISGGETIIESAEAVDVNIVFGSSF